jgi:hypothetical protein
MGEQMRQYGGMRQVAFASLILGAVLVIVACGGGGEGSSTPPPNPVPSITSLSPSSATAGAAAQTLTINGTNFLSSSTVTYNGAAHTATFVSSTQLTISLSASDQATAGVYAVIVTNPPPGGGASNSFTFTVNNSAVPGTPLVVDGNSHVVVMEYEAWFGPHSVTFQGTAAMPELQSADMQPVGGGYDSADPAVIQQHVAWMEYMGMDAALVDLTNNVACIFNSESFVMQYVPNCPPSFRIYNQTIRDNTGNLYPAWSELGTPLKVIPLLGGIDQNVLYEDTDGTTAFEKEIAYFGALMAQYPGCNVIYEGEPLMLIYVGAPQDPNPSDNPLWFEIREFLNNHPEIESKYTFKMMAGDLDSQPGLWATQGTPNGPVEINPEYGFWSWVDRLNPSCTVSLCPYYPSYNVVSGNDGSRAENFTASIATAGQSGWGCPNPRALPYCPDDSLRFGANNSYATLASFMNIARQLDPIFLIIHQFNEFVPPDEGFDANTDDDTEPANLWGHGALDAVQQQITLYHQQTKTEARPRRFPGRIER